VKRNARGGERGAVMVETALVVGTILTLLLFGIQVGVLGFLQLTVDAASFVNARENALSIANPAGTTGKIFPQIAAGNITNSTAPAPLPSMPTDYGYNSTDPTVAQNSVFNRHGGVSMMEPQLATSSVAKPGVFQPFAAALGVLGQSTESYWQECGIHGNIANSTAPCGGSSPPPNFSGDYFSKGENTPPYFASFNYMAHCKDAQPWSSPCSPGNQDFIALGVATYLTADNWGGNLQPGLSGGKGSSTFQQVACHQRVFAALAQFLAPLPNLTALYGLYGVGVYCQLYPSSCGQAPATFNDFGKWNAFDPQTSADVRQVYTWDQRVQAGYPQPGKYPLNPTAGC